MNAAAPPPIALSAVFIVNLRGDVLIERQYRSDITRANIDQFKTEILNGHRKSVKRTSTMMSSSGNNNTSSKGDVQSLPPVRIVGQIKFMFIRVANVYVCAATKLNVNVSMCFAFLKSAIGTFQVPSEEFVGKNEEGCRNLLIEKIHQAYEGKRKLENPEQIQSLERYVVVNAADVHWQDHLTEMEELRRSVSLRGYGQKDPLSEYKSEAFRAFEEMMGSMRSEVCSGMFRAATNLAAFENMLSTLSKSAKSTGPDSGGSAGFDRFSAPSSPAPQVDEFSAPKVAAPVVREAPKVGRNDPCPCGSGKKYKKCCGVGAAA